MDFQTVLDILIPLLTFFMGILSASIISIKEYAARHADAEVKRYAAERDFGHLKRNYENLSLAIADLARTQEESFNRLIDIVRSND